MTERSNVANLMPLCPPGEAVTVKGKGEEAPPPEPSPHTKAALETLVVQQQQKKLLAISKPVVTGCELRN